MICLNGEWEMRELGTDAWIKATVPGTMYMDLLDNNLIEDPYFRDNELEAMKLSDKDYEYIRTFVVEKDMLEHDRVEIVFEGLDTFARIYINKMLLAKTENMHRTYIFDVKNYLFEGQNEIQVVFESPNKKATEANEKWQLWGVNAIPGFNHLRKSHCQFGWDWGPVLPDMGIWRPAYIQWFDEAKINDVYISQVHEDNKVTLNNRFRYIPFKDDVFDIKCEITAPDGRTFEASVDTSASKMQLGMEADGVKRELSFSIEIDSPMLWWPNGLGEQNLYNVKFTLANKNGDVLDTYERSIGLRTLTVTRDPYEHGERFNFVVNGIHVFAMGADYIPEDCIYNRVTREQTETLIKDCVKAHFNCFRVWGGAVYPDDYLFDLCDKYGLIVWEDFMFACAAYPFDEHFAENVKYELIDNIKRIRHHACLGLWCGNNECETAFDCWNIKPIEKKDYAKYTEQYEVLFPAICKEFDPNTFYWPSSPSSGGGFDDPHGFEKGDCHFWGVWHGREPFDVFRKYIFRFASEYGMQAFPNYKTILEYTLPEDRNIYSYVMENYQKSGTGNEVIMYYVSSYLKFPKNFESIVYCSQVLQGEAIRFAVEHFRRNRGKCMGSIYWQLNDCWPGPSWSSIDSKNRWKALHYFAKRFYSPILISANETDTKAELHVTNDTLEDFSGTVRWALKNNKGETILSDEAPAQCSSLSATKLLDLDFSVILADKPAFRSHYLQYELLKDGEIISDGTVTFAKMKHFSLLEPSFEIEVQDAEDKYVIEIASDVYAKYVSIQVDGADVKLSDSFFDLAGAGYKKTIILPKEEIKLDAGAEQIASVEQLKARIVVKSLFETYE